MRMSVGIGRVAGPLCVALLLAACRVPAPGADAGSVEVAALLAASPTPDGAEATALAVMQAALAAAPEESAPSANANRPATLSFEEQLATALAATLTAQPTATPTPTSTPDAAATAAALEAAIQTSVAATLLAQPTATTNHTPTPSPTETPDVDATLDAESAVRATAQAQVQARAAEGATATAQASRGAASHVATGGGALNLRSGPGTQYPVLAQLADGTIVNVLGRSADSQWLHVETAGGITGWGGASFFSTGNSVSAYAVAVAPPVPTPAACSLPVDGQLAHLWERSRLGCPIEAARVIWSSWTPFERGHLIWRRDTNKVYAFYNSGWWQRFEDQWDQVSEPQSRGAPPPGLVAPTRGTGWLWGRNDTLFSELGWALRDQRGLCSLVQHFEKGFILRSNMIEFCQDTLYNTAREGDWPLDSFTAVDGGGWTINLR